MWWPGVSKQLETLVSNCPVCCRLRVQHDYFSRYVEIAKLSGESSVNVIKHLKSIFARHGIPQELVTDNGPQYSSREFSKFTENFGFIHTNSSPKFPQSNGEAERGVQTTKNLLKKSDDHT